MLLERGICRVLESKRIEAQRELEKLEGNIQCRQNERESIFESKYVCLFEKSRRALT